MNKNCNHQWLQIEKQTAIVSPCVPKLVGVFNPSKTCLSMDHHIICQMEHVLQYFSMHQLPTTSSLYPHGPLYPQYKITVFDGTHPEVCSEPQGESGPLPRAARLPLAALGRFVAVQPCPLHAPTAIVGCRSWVGIIKNAQPPTSHN